MAPFYDHNGKDISDDLDRWITGNWGEDSNPEPEPERPTLEDLADLAYEREKEREVEDGV